jgi:hypothetical protein
MSRTFSISSGSVESLKLSLRCGRKPNARQIRATLLRLRPTRFASDCSALSTSAVFGLPVRIAALLVSENEAMRDIDPLFLCQDTSEVGTADCIRHVYPAWRSSLQTPTSGSQTLATTRHRKTGSAGGPRAPLVLAGSPQ